VITDSGHRLPAREICRLARDEQVILFLNRRGYSPQLKCAECGEVPLCPPCQVRLTYHKVGHKLSCHYCGYVDSRYETCARCGSAEFIHIGAGTQKVEENLPRLFEGARAMRLDSDTAAGRTGVYTILSDFAAGKGNLLLGTQMVTKGLDLPDVTLVGVLSADASLDMPDFRASEKAFSRLLQVAGRSGRADKPGEVLIQTWYPEHDVIVEAASQDYDRFYRREIEARRPLAYPPFSRLVNFVLSDRDENRLQGTALEFRERLDEHMRQAGATGQILGPAPCPMPHLKGLYRRHLFVKTSRVVALVRMLTDWERRDVRFKLPASTKLVVDVDPDDMT